MSYELDREVAERVMGWDDWSRRNVDRAFHPSEDMGAAQQVIHRLKSRGVSCRLRNDVTIRDEQGYEHDAWEVSFLLARVVGRAVCPTLPEAVCRAALQARQRLFRLAIPWEE